MNSSPSRLDAWLSHLRSVLPDLKDVTTEERPWDKSRYLVVTYVNGVVAPSWTLSDGTLRLFALTIPAYIQDFSGVYLIEEPENGIHPRAVEALFQSLTSVYGAQVLMASHSPVVLGLAEPASVLCFAKTESGATDIVRGSEHPALKHWQGEENLGVLFAGGVLG
jgi:predicted ATPase